MNWETNQIENSDTTFIVDRETKRVVKLAGGKEAFVQYIYMALQTERFKFPIFSNNYGMESKDLISKQTEYIEALLPKRIRDCLNDKRVLGINRVDFDNSKNAEKEMSVSAYINSVYGETKVEVDL